MRKSLVLTVLLSLLALAVTAVAALVLPPHYQAESDVALLPSVNSAKPYGYNPYMNFSGSLPMAAEVISYQLMNPAKVQQLKAEGYDQPFTVTIATAVTTGPVLTIQVTGGDKAAVQRTLDGVTQGVSTEVASLQEGVTQRNRITVLTVSSDLTPQLVVSKTARPLVLILGIGLALAFAIPRLMVGRGRRKTTPKPDPVDWPAEDTRLDHVPGRTDAVPAGDHHAPSGRSHHQQEDRWNRPVFAEPDGYEQPGGYGEQPGGYGRPDDYGDRAGYGPAYQEYPAPDQSLGAGGYDPDRRDGRVRY